MGMGEPLFNPVHTSFSKLSKLILLYRVSSQSSDLSTTFHCSILFFLCCLLTVTSAGLWGGLYALVQKPKEAN